MYREAASPPPGQSNNMELEQGPSVLDRLERRRERRELEDRAIREGRLPPGQSLTIKWPVLDTGFVPDVDQGTWRFRLFGLVRQPRELDWQTFSSLRRVTSVGDIHCVTHWTKLNNEWEGISARDVIDRAEPLSEARYVMVHAPGYTANLPLEALLEDDVLFALKHDGEDLSREHGGPVRLVVPKRYFWKSVKWVNGLEFMAEDRPGYWEQRGYHLDGDPWREERYGEV